MAIQPYFPRNSELISQEAGLVLVNHAGATVSQDTGRDAQALADALRLVVVAADRPGTAGTVPRRAQRNALATPSGYAAESASLGYAIDHQADMLGLKRLAITGRSAGGLGALALIRSETISAASYLFAAEPPGCKAIPLKQGLQEFKEYSVRQKQLQQQGRVHVPPRSALQQPQAMLRLGSIAKNVFYDRFHNDAVWASDAAVVFSRHIAANQPTVSAAIVFAEHSLVVDNQTYEQELLPTTNLRTKGAPFMIDQIASTTHASFDDQNLFALLLRPTVEHMLSHEV